MRESFKRVFDFFKGDKDPKPATEEVSGKSIIKFPEHHLPKNPVTLKLDRTDGIVRDVGMEDTIPFTHVDLQGESEEVWLAKNKIEVGTYVSMDGKLYRVNDIRRGKIYLNRTNR